MAGQFLLKKRKTVFSPPPFHFLNFSTVVVYLLVVLNKLVVPLSIWIIALLNNINFEHSLSDAMIFPFTNSFQHSLLFILCCYSPLIQYWLSVAMSYSPLLWFFSTLLINTLSKFYLFVWVLLFCVGFTFLCRFYLFV